MTDKELFEEAVKAHIRLEEGGDLSFYNSFKAGFDYAVNKACEWLYEYNSQQAKAHGSKGVLHIGEFTINVYDFRKALEPLPN